MRLVRVLLITLVVVSIVGTGAWWFFFRTTTTSDPAANPDSTEAAAESAVPPAAPATNIVAGTPSTAEVEVAPRRTASLSFSVSGLLAERIVDVGTLVAEGEPILRLEDSRERARLAEAQAALAAAEAAVASAQAGAAAAERQRAVQAAAITVVQAQRDAAEAALRLTATQADATIDQAQAGARQAAAAVAQAEANAAASLAALEQAEAQVTLAEAQRAQAEAAVATAQLAVEERTLRAPFTGRVLEIGFEVGEAIGASNAATVVFADTSSWIVETTNLTELQVVGVAEGDVVEVEVDALPSVTFSGIVERVSFVPELVRGDVTYVATIGLDVSSSEVPEVGLLRPGMTGIVRGLLED